MLFSVKNITFDRNGNVYVKYPLGNVKYINKDDWKFSENDLPIVFNELEANLGHDLTILKAGTFVHPFNYPTSKDPDTIFREVTNYQKPFVIGKNDRVYRSVDENGFIWGRYHITNNRAKDYYKNLTDSSNSEIPFHSSIMLVLNGEQDKHDIKHFKVIHNAVVSDPQWGFNSKMRAICVGNDGQCDQALLAAGNLVEPCKDMTKLYNNFFDSLNSYILSAGNINDKNMSEQDKPEENGGEGGGEGGKKASTSGNKMPIDINWKDEVKKYVDESITAKLPKVEPKPETKQEDMTKKPEPIDVNALPQSVIDSIVSKVSEKYGTQIKDLTDKIENQKTTIDSFQSERREQNVGRMLLEYQDFFRGKDGKIDGKLFDDNLKYWSAKQGNEEDIKLDLEHSFDIAKNYIANLSLPTEQISSKTETPTQQDVTESKRDRIIKEVEDEQLKLGIVKQAGNVQDELETTYQNILAKKGNNDRIVNSNDRLY
jgi:hypothetical protein